MGGIPFSLIAKLVGMLALVGVGFGLGYKFEHGSVLAAEASLTSYKASVAAQVAIEEQKSAQIVAQHDALSNQIQNTYATQLVKIQEAYNAKTSPAARITCTGGMRDSAGSGGAHLSTSGAAPGLIDGKTIDGLAARLPQDCADTTLQLEELQRWAAGIAK